MARRFTLEIIEEDGRVSKVYGTLPASLSPATPTGLAEGDVTAGYATLAWDAAADATLYQVYRDGAPIGAPTANTVYVDSAVVPETTYSYQVQASNSAGSSDLSGALDITTLANSLPVWSLTDQTMALGAAYSLDLTTVCEDGDSHPLTFTLPSGSVPGLTLSSPRYAGTPTAIGSYPLTFRANDGYGASDVPVTFRVVDTDVTAPTVPTGVSAAAVGSTVTVSWNASTDAANSVATYRIYRNGIFRASDTASPYVESGVPAGTYSYTVSAVDSSANANESAQSAGSSVTITEVTLDAPVSFVAAPDGVGNIDLSWLEGPSGAVSTGYELQRSTNQTTWTNVEEYVSPALFVTDSNLVAGTLYYYRVRGTRSGFTPSAYATTSAQNVVVTPPIGTFETDTTYSGSWRGTNTVPTEDVVTGWDWTMPGNVAKPAHGGVFTQGNSAYPAGWQGNKIKAVNAAWRYLEPSVGNYDLSTITGPMNDSAYDGIFLNVRGWVSATPTPADVDITAPTWATVANGYSTYTTVSNYTITSLVAFDEPARTRHLALIAAIGNSPLIYPSDRIWGQIIHTPGASRGEEYNTAQGNKTASAAAAVEYIQAWVAAAGAARKKYLMWTDDRGNNSDPAIDRRTPADAALAAGIGARGGAIEAWLWNLYTPGLTDYTMQTWSGGYLGVNETAPTITAHRAWHDQNESAGTYSTPSSAVQQQNYRMGHLRMLQMRRNLLWVRAGYTMNPKMDNWAGVQAGHDVTTSPEAWICLMRTWTYSSNNGTGAARREIRNFERWLYQRETYGITTPSINKNHGPLTATASNKSLNTNLLSADWNIDLARQGPSIGIAVDDEFIVPGTSDSVCIKVMYVNTGTSTWSLQYTKTNGTVATKSVTCTNTNAVRTATFYIPDFKNPASGFSPDFYLKSSDASVPFMFVRVMKL